MPSQSTFQVKGWREKNCFSPVSLPLEWGQVEGQLNREGEKSCKIPRGWEDWGRGSRNPPPQGKGYKRAEADPWSALDLKGKSSRWCEGELGTPVTQHQGVSVSARGSAAPSLLVTVLGTQKSPA